MSGVTQRVAGLWGRAAALARKPDDWGFAVGAWPGDTWVTRGNRALIVVWGILGAWSLVPTSHFTYDQAYFYEMSVRTAEALLPPAYGPFISGVQTGALTPGGMLFVFYAPAFFFAKDPRVGMAFIHLLAVVGMLLFDAALRRFDVKPAVRLCTVILLNWAGAHARATQTFWNGDLFVLITPLLLYLTARLCEKPERGHLLALAFGVVAATQVQTHLSGLMAVAVCLAIWVLYQPRTVGWSRLLAVATGLALAYLPYFWVEWRSGFPNGEALKAAVPQGMRWDNPAVLRSLLTPAMFTSHAESVRELLPPTGQDWTRWAFALTGWAGGLLAVWGLLTRFRLKLVALLVMVGLPPFFILSNRDFYDHYALPVVPFAVLLTGAGAGWLVAGGRIRRAVGLAYLGAFVGSGFALLVIQRSEPVLHRVMPWNGMSVQYQLDRVKAHLDRGENPPSGPGDESAFIRGIVARRLLGRELEFNVSGLLCQVDLRLPGFGPPPPTPPGRLVVPLHSNTVFICRRPS